MSITEISLKPTDLVQALASDEKGATAIEYGPIAALIAVAAVSAMTGLGSQISKTLTNVTTQMSKG